MSNLNTIDTPEMEKVLRTIVKAIEKAVGLDVRMYLSESGTDTNNALMQLRGDYINTNLRDMVVADNENIELHHFRRFLWTGSYLIDRSNKITINVSSKGTIERIRRRRNRNSPHYLETMCHTLNHELVADQKQLTIDGTSMYLSFSDEEYEEDFERIFDLTLAQNEGYRHYVVAYEVERFEIKGLSLLLLDKELDVVNEISLMDWVQPDFGVLTAPEINESINLQYKDSRDLIKVKPGVKSKRSSEPQKKSEYPAKKEEVAKQA